MKVQEIALWYRNHVLVYRLMGKTYRTISRLPILRILPKLEMYEVRHWFCAVVSLIFTLATEVIVFYIGGARALEESLFFTIALGVVFFLTLRQAEMVGRRVVNTLLIKIDPPVKDMQIWKSVSKEVKGQFGAAFIVMIGSIPVTTELLKQVLTKQVPLWPIVAFVCAEVWVISSSAYMAIFSSGKFVKALKSLDLDLYPFDPAHTPVLKAISNFFAGIMLEQGILGAAIVLLFFTVKPTVFVSTIGTIVLIFIVFMLVGNFIYAQLTIAGIIAETKEQTILELQDKIKDIYSHNIGHIVSSEENDVNYRPEKGEQLSQLLDLYERVVKSPNLAIDVESIVTYLSSIVWPILSLFTVNLPIPKDLIDYISRTLDTIASLISQFL